MSDVKTIDVRTGVETMRPYTDAEKAQITKDENEYPAQTFEALRRMRDQKLAETDWVVTKAVEAGESVASDVQTYRKDLRDLPSTLNDTTVLSFDWEDGWPTKPDGI